MEKDQEIIRLDSVLASCDSGAHIVGTSILEHGYGRQSKDGKTEAGRTYTRAEADRRAMVEGADRFTDSVSLVFEHRLGTRRLYGECASQFPLDSSVPMRCSHMHELRTYAVLQCYTYGCYESSGQGGLSTCLLFMNVPEDRSCSRCPLHGR